MGDHKSEIAFKNDELSKFVQEVEKTYNESPTAQSARRPKSASGITTDCEIVM